MVHHREEEEENLEGSEEAKDLRGEEVRREGAAEAADAADPADSADPAPGAGKKL